MTSDRERTRLGWTVLVLAPALVPCAACDPLVDVAGAFFPAWMVCILVGIASTVLVRHFLVRARLEPSLGPLLIVYPSLAATIALALWLGFYRGSP
jgi:YtcA family